MATHHRAPTRPTPAEDASDEGLDLLEAYNFADAIQTRWENSEVPVLAPLALRWLDSSPEAPPLPRVEDEVASETESIEDSDVVLERNRALQEMDREEQMGSGPGEGLLGDEDQPLTSDDEDIEDFYMWPKFMDSIIYRIGHEVAVSRLFMNKPERKVYFGHRRSDRLPVAVIVGKEYDARLRHGDMPREVRIMLRLRGQKNVAELLGWCPVGCRHFVLVLRHYRSADMVEASNQNLFIISKMMQSVFEALEQVHGQKVVHRDVAKSNLLWNPLTDTVTIIDFDNACFFRAQGYYRDVGRDRYDAPEKTEMLELRRKLKSKLAESSKKRLPASKIKKRLQAYHESADLYSLGVLLWMLLNGEHKAPSPRKLKDWVAKVKQRNRHKKYTELDLLVRLLHFDPQRRITLEEALAHPFLTQRPEKPDNDYAHMKAYLFKKLAMETECEAVVNTLDDTTNHKDEDASSRSSESGSQADSGGGDDSRRAAKKEEEEDDNDDDDEDQSHTGRSSDDEEEYEDHEDEYEDEEEAPPVGADRPTSEERKDHPEPLRAAAAAEQSAPALVRKPAFLFAVKP